MKVGVMQPYLFPYIGYWQLLNAVDKYVILDDVNYIMRGYINRNNILIAGEAKRFSVPVYHASQNKLISESRLNFDAEEKKKFMNTIKMAYGKAPLFKAGYELVEDIIYNDTDDLTEYIAYSMERIDGYLGIETPLIRSSQIKKDPSLRGQDRIIAICHSLDADTYINPSGGRDLYSQERFRQESMQLLFLDPIMDNIVYEQFGGEFVNYLSIIDVIMFNDVPAIKDLLNQYELSEI